MLGVERRMVPVRLPLLPWRLRLLLQLPLPLLLLPLLLLLLRLRLLLTLPLRLRLVARSFVLPTTPPIH